MGEGLFPPAATDWRFPALASAGYVAQAAQTFGQASAKSASSATLAASRCHSGGSERGVTTARATCARWRGALCDSTSTPNARVHPHVRRGTCWHICPTTRPYREFVLSYARKEGREMGALPIVAAVLAVAALSATSAQAELILDTSFSKNFPFGPFRPSEKIEILVSLTNTSLNQTATICEGPCIGDSFTYSLGGLAGVPAGYSFYFGDKKTEAVFDGQIAGVLSPGEEKDFVFGFYDPVGTVAPGVYNFSTQLQIFDATPNRLMLAAPTFSGQWEVRAMPEPASVALVAPALLGICLSRRQKRDRGVRTRGLAGHTPGRRAPVSGGSAQSAY